MQEITITRKLDAEQWVEGGPLPGGTFNCLPEICWSADRSLIYFTYAELRPRHWVGVARDPVPADPDKACGPFDGLCVYDPKDGERYARKMLPFATWSVKSEQSVQRNWRPEYVDGSDQEMLALWHDYCAAEQFPNPIPRRIEYRDIDGNYGRGYRPVYLKPGDWLLRENVPHGHDNLGTKVVVSAVSDADFRRMSAA
jgi:hypothetical protein